MEDNYSKLYKAMVNSGYDTADLGGSEDDFRREMQDSTTRKNFYDWVSNNEMNGFRIGSYDAYEERLAPNEATAPQAVAAPQLEADKSAYTFTAEELGIEESNGNAPAAPVELQYDGTKPVVPGMAKEGDIPGIDMEAYNANMAKAMAEGKVLSPGETQRRFEEREAEVAARLPQARARMNADAQVAATMKGAFDRAYGAAKGVYYADEAERLTKGLLDEYSAERAKRLSQVEKDVENYNSARRWAVSNPYATDAYSEVAYRSNATKLRNADELGMMEEFAKDAKKRLLADENLKAKAEENAELLGMPVERYINEVAVPIMQERMYSEWLAPQEERAKRNYNGFAAAAEGSLIGTLLGATRTDTEKYLSQVGQEAWRKNASLLGRAAAGAGSMFLDLPVFMGAGSLASVPAKAVGGQVFKQLAKNETKRLVARGVAEGAAQRYANYAVRNGLKNRILLNLSTAPLQSGLTFGMFDAGKAALNMSLNGEWDWKELGKSAVGGTLMGGALGATGAVGGGLTHGLTGATKAAAKVAEFGVENAVFTEGGRLIGKLHGQQPENGWLEDYVESGATLLMIKAPNIVKNVSAIKGDKEASEVFAFNRLEREQLGKYGEDLNAVLESLLPQSKRVFEDALKINEGTFTEEYRRVMSDPEVSMTTKAKLMGIVEGKVMPAPRAVDAKIEGNRVMTYDPMGRLVEVKEYATKTKAEAEYKKAADKAEIESIAVMEDVYMRIKGYEADELTVKEWLANNPKVTMERVAEIVAKNSAGEKLTEAEQKILESLRQARREGLNDVRHLNDVLAGLDVDPYDVMSGLDKPIDKRTERENRAVRAYTDVLFREVKDKIQEPYRRGEAQRAADDVWRAANNVRWANEDVKLLADRIYESDRSVDETANDGMVYTTTTPSGEKIIITGGKVVLDNEGYIDVNQSEGLVAMFPDGQKKPVRPGDLREKVEVSNAEEIKAAKREEIVESAIGGPMTEPTADASQNGNLVPGAEIEVAFEGEIYKLKVDGRDERGDVILSGEGASMAMPESVVQEGMKQAETLKAENGKALQTENQIEAPVAQAETVQPAPKTALEQNIPVDEKGKKMWEQSTPEYVAEYIRVRKPEDVEAQMSVVSGMIEGLEKQKSKMDAMDAMDVDDKIAFWEKVGELIGGAKDVVDPISQLNAKHSSALTAFNSMLENIRREGNEQKAAIRYEGLENMVAEFGKQLPEGYTIGVVDGKYTIVETQPAETTPVVESAPVEEVETPQPANEMQSADLENGEKGQKAVEPVGETDSSTLSQTSDQVSEKYVDPNELSESYIPRPRDNNDANGIEPPIIVARNKDGKIRDYYVDMDMEVGEHNINGNETYPPLEVLYDEYGEEFLKEHNIDPAVLPAAGKYRLLGYNNLGFYIDFNGGEYFILGFGAPEHVTQMIKQGDYRGLMADAPKVESAQKAEAPGQSGVEEIQEPRSVEEVLENGDKRITNYNSRGEVATVATERDGKVVSVDSYDEGVLFEHTEYDGNGVSTSVTRYDKQGNAIGTQVYVDGKAVPSETTEQPETGEVANAGPVNRETLQLNMSEEDFNALLNSGNKAAISEYLAEMDGLLRIGAGSPLDGRDTIVKEYRGVVEQYGGEDNIPADVVAGFDERSAPYNALQRAVFDRKYALQDKLREIEASEAQAKEQAEKEAKAEHKKTAFGGFLAGKTDLGASAAEKALNKKYNFDGKVMTVAEFVEEAVANGNAKLLTIEEPKYKGASRAAWNRMDARQQEADAKRVKESGTKTVYTVNDHDFGKTAYDYAKFLLDKKAEQEKAAAKQKVKDAIEPFAKEKAAEQAPIKIEDVGEKIGGARKDVIRKYADKIKLDGKTFGTMFPKPEIDQLVEAGLPLDRVAAVKAMFDNAKREYERTKKRMGKDKALSASLFYAMYAKNVLNGETDNFDLKYNGWVFTDWGKEYMKANIALYRAVFEKLGAEYGKMDLAKYAITPLDAQHKKMLNLKALNESNARMQALRAKEKGEEPPVYKDGDLINFVGENHARPSDQFETLEEAVNAMVERIGKEVKPGAEALYKPEVYWKTDERGRADYSKIFVGVKVRGFGTVDLMEFKSSNEARQWLDEHGDDFQQMAAAKEVQVKAENKKPLPKYSIEYTLDRVNSQYAVVANFGRGKVHTLRTFDFPEDDARARMSVFKDEVMPFLNSQEAVQAANEYAEELQQKKSAPKNVVVEKNSRERVGVDWRNGQDATTEMFVDVEGKEPSVFGFRALEFGNYVSQKERQQYLNDIYDALMDMSEVLGVSPRALSLGGKLALAVGARGTSGASGHYEPYKNVINITKTKGAGVLAHEWLHALDRYFSNFDENALYPNGVRYATGKEYAENTRQEIKDAFEKIMSAVRGGEYQKRSARLGDYWASDKELAARALQDYMMRKLDERGQKNDFLSNHLAPEDWAGDMNNYPFPLGAEADRIAEAFDNFFATVEEKTEDGQTVLFQQGMIELDRENPAFERATKVTMDAVERLKANGLDIEVVSQEEADAMMELAEMQKRTAPETASVQDEHQPTVVSSADKRKSPETALPEDESSFKGTAISSDDGAKILKDIDSAIAKYENSNDRAETFIGNVAKALGIDAKDKSSKYATFEAKNGVIFTIRISNHNATVSNFDNAGEGNGISIVISRKPNEGITNDGNAHLVEFFYPEKKISKADGKPLVEILKSIKQALYSGEYKDNTGLAVREEVNIPEMMTVFHGSGAKFDRFDHSFMGTGEGAQAFGWGTYVTEVEGIGRSYAGVGVTKLGSLQAKLGNIDSAISLLEKEVQRAEKDLTSDNETARHIAAYTLETASERRKALEEEKAAVEEEIKPYRNLYTVDIPDDNGSNYLHWEERINGEIQERIANGLQSIGFEIEPNMNHLAYSRDEKIAVLNINAKGADLYTELSEALGGDKAASEFLSNLGFVGISYPAEAMTGGRADGARNYVIFNENDAKITNRVEFLRTAGGKVYGWAVDGKIRLTPDGINPNTPVHEYAHLWGADVEKSNPKLWNEVVEAMKLSPVWNEVANDANYSNIHGNDNRMASEVLARLSGRENYRRTVEEAEKEIAAERDIVGKVQKKGILNRIKNALKSFWNWVQRNVFKQGERSNVKAESESASEVMPWEEFANSVVGDFYKGKNPDVKESSLDRMAASEAKKESAGKSVVKNNANFVSTYKTKDGKDIEYTSERAEGYGVQGYGTDSSNSETGHSILQRQTDTGVPGGNSGLNTEKGEFCVVERVFTENGAFNFTSGEKIESADDVAYIFSALEDAAKEHSFVVYVKDGKPTVIELGMGSFNATMVDIPTASLAYSRISPDHVYFVHNHPSGNLICSDQDVAMLREFEDMSDVPVTGVIINLKTGKYGTFDTERHSVIGEKRVPENEERLIVHTLDKQIFAPDYDPMVQPLVRSSQDVAQFLNSQRMGDRPKVSFLILSRANRIIGNIHTPFTDITTDTEAVARYINERIIQFGGENAVLYGDFAISYDEAGGFRLLQNAMERFGKTKLLDVVRVEGNFTKSANDHGFLYEPEADYGVVKESEQGYGSTEEDIPVGEVESKPLTFAEKITNSVLEASAKNKENLALRSDALRMYGRDIANVLKLMGKQREYDKSTVNQLVKLAKMYFKDAQLLGGLTPYQVGRVMTRLNSAVGKRDITDDANELVNILVDAHNKELDRMLDKAAKTKAKKVNASGVEVIGKLDKEGQLLLEEYNNSKVLDLETIDEKILDLQNEAADASGNVEGESGEPDAERTREVAARLRGLELARQYREEILKKRDEIKGLEQELKSAEQDAKDGAMDRAAYKEFRRATERAILESKLEMVDAYHGLIHGLSGDISSSAKRAKLFQQAQIDHVREIQHNANSDLLGHPAEAQGETPDKWNSAVPRFFMAAMPTFQTMLKFFGEKAADGRGYLYERFIPQHTQASHNEYVGKTEAREKMRDKLTEIFGKKTTIENFMDMSRKDGAVLEYQEGGQKKTIDLTRGQVLYLYMINKMADGQMKLSRMGITDADVLKMAKELPEEMVRFADWVQEDFLTELREKYNKVHERMFGAPMAAIESYFPIKINKRSRGEKIEPGMNAEDKPSTVTGSVIKRTKNAVAIDLSADAMQVLLGHIDDMENWAAWAEFRRDVKSLLNYRHFQNQVKGMESLRYGSGEKLWKNFVDVANIAAGSFKPSSTAADRAVRNIAKGVVSSKIAFRYFTAVKQILSTPAFWSEVDFGKMMNAYLHQKEAWDWAMKNLPGFSKRWEGRASGNEILLESDADWKVWQNRAVQWLSKEGMRANAFIDALTVATGAKAVFETKYEMFKKAGYSEERAREKALNRAAEAYNESQQSSESAYLSPLQAEATFVSSVLTAYRNSPFGYNRKMATAIANLKKKMKKGFKQESIEYMIKQLMRDGLNEEQAKKFAKSTYRRSVARDAADVALYEFFLNYVWVLGPSLIYILGGDDDEKKKELNVEALIDGAMGGLGNLPAGETLTGAIKAIAEGDVSNFKLPQAVAMQDMETIADLMQTDPVRAAGEVLNILVAMGVGVNPQTFTDMFVALADTEDWSDPREIAMLVLRLINAPNSKLELLEADEAMENYGANIEEITREYAEYQKSKRAPLSGWLYSDESEQKAIERYEKRFKKILDERFEVVVENTDEYDMWYENSDPQMKAKLAKLRQKFLEGDKETTMEKLDSIDVTKKVLFGSGYDEVNTVYYELSTAEDEDMAMMIDQKLKELKPVYEEHKTKGKEFYELHKREIDLYGELMGWKNAANGSKRAMKDDPEQAQRYMNEIREYRTKAIELINNYNE